MAAMGWAGILARLANEGRRPFLTDAAVELWGCWFLGATVVGQIQGALFIRCLFMERATVRGFSRRVREARSLGMALAFLNAFYWLAILTGASRIQH